LHPQTDTNINNNNKISTKRRKTVDNYSTSLYNVLLTFTRHLYTISSNYIDKTAYSGALSIPLETIFQVFLGNYLIYLPESFNLTYKILMQQIIVF